MEPTTFDELAFFRAIQESGVRALLIGRRALVLLGIPVLTADYDYWIAIDDIAAFNTACAPFDLHPTRTSDEARKTGRYVLENGERIDVLVARAVPTIDGCTVTFDNVWPNRRSIELQPGVAVHLPNVDDLILTKQFAARPKDLEDIRLLRALHPGDSR